MFMHARVTQRPKAGLRRQLVTGLHANRITNPIALGTDIASTPPGWGILTASSALTAQIVAVKEAGPCRILYIRANGTSNASDRVSINPQLVNFVAGLGDVFDLSYYVTLVAGSMANVSSVAIYSDHLAGGGGYLGGDYNSPDFAALIGARKPLQRSKVTYRATASTSGVGLASSYLAFNHGNTVSVDWTIALAMPATVKV